MKNSPSDPVVAVLADQLTGLTENSSDLARRIAATLRDRFDIVERGAGEPDVVREPIIGSAAIVAAEALILRARSGWSGEATISDLAHGVSAGTGLSALRLRSGHDEMRRGPRKRRRDAARDEGPGDAAGDDDLMIVPADVGAIDDIDRWVTMAGLTPCDDSQVLGEAVRSGRLGIAVDTADPERGMRLLQSLIRSGRGLYAATASTVVYMACTAAGAVEGVIVAGPATLIAAQLMAQSPEVAAVYMASVLKIHAIGVAPDVRRRGTGRRLVEAVIAQATAAQYRVVYGQYHLDRDASLRPFCTGLGFAVRAPGRAADWTPALGPLAAQVKDVPGCDEVLFDRDISTSPVY